MKALKRKMLGRRVCKSIDDNSIGMVFFENYRNMKNNFGDVDRNLSMSGMGGGLIKYVQVRKVTAGSKSTSSQTFPTESPVNVWKVTPNFRGLHLLQT